MPNADFIPGLVAVRPVARRRRSSTSTAARTINQQAAYVQDDIKAGQRHVQARASGRSLRRAHVEDARCSRALGVSYAVPRSGHHPARVLRPHARNAVQREPAAFEQGRSGGRSAPSGAAAAARAARSGRGRCPAGDSAAGWSPTSATSTSTRPTATTSACSSTRRSSFRCRGIIRRIDGITGAHQSRRAPRLQRLHRDRPHQRDLLAARHRRPPHWSCPTGDFRIDHDQKFQQTTNVQYAFDKTLGAWAAFSWRYDSGLVAGSVPDYATALAFTGDQQAAIGLFCGGTFATLDAPITALRRRPNRGATRLRIPADGTGGRRDQPAAHRAAHLFDLGFGVDNLLRDDAGRKRASCASASST